MPDPDPGPLPDRLAFDPHETVEIGRLAVKTAIGPLKEYVDGQLRHAKILQLPLPGEE